MVDPGKLSEVLSEFARSMTNDASILGVAERLVGCIVRVLPVTGAAAMLTVPGTGSRHVVGSDDAARLFGELQLQIGAGPAWLAERTGEAVSITDLRADARFPELAAATAIDGPAGVFSFPLRHDCCATRSPGCRTDGRWRTASSTPPSTPTAATPAQRSCSPTSTSSSMSTTSTGTPSVTSCWSPWQAGCRCCCVRATRWRASPATSSCSCAEDLASTDDVDLITSRIADAFTVPFEWRDHAFTLTVSVGAAYAAAGERISTHLVAEADKAMYAAKRSRCVR